MTSQANMLANMSETTQKILNDMWRDIRVESRKRQLEAIAKNPKAHKLTKIMGERGSNYAYMPAGKDGRGRTIRYCWSKHRNAAGYFLGWREVWEKDGLTGKRDQFFARKVKRRAAELQSRRAERFKASRAPAPTEAN